MICPHCGLGVHLEFVHRETQGYPDYTNTHKKYQLLSAVCPACGDYVVTLVHLKNASKDDAPAKEIITREIIFPRASTAPMPTADMPEEIKGDYMEARAVVDASPRAAAALLRLCVQKLMPLLGEKGDNINDDIASLVKKGLPSKIQKALDSLRVIGNESVHPGTIDLNDDRDTALAIFDFLNLIVESEISQPKKIDDVYSKLPKSKLDGISKRDGKK